MIKLLLFSFILFLSCFACNAQQFLQLETINDPESKKFRLGDKITIKTQSDQEWHQIQLKQFLYSDSIVLTDDGMVKVNEVTHILDYRPGINILSRTFQTFATSYLVYGLIGSLSDRGDKFSSGDAIVAGSSFLIGWAMRKAFYKREFEMGSRYRLRLLDLRI